MAFISDAVELAAGIVLIGGAAGLMWWHLRKRRPNLSNSSPLASHSSAQLVRQVNNRPKNHLPILSAQELLERTDTLGLVEIIRTRLGLAPENFASDVLPVLHRYAEYVQLLPGSESHHHAQPGGLLQHTLEVVANALAIRQGYKLPTGAVPEQQIQRASVWSFGVLVAALLHDVGKPVADVVVLMYGGNLAQSCGSWNGLVGPIRDQAAAKQATHYTVAFPLVKDYSAHQRLPVTLLHALVPSRAMQWLGSDDRLLQELFAYLDNNEKVATALREIVTKADSQSVAQNLKFGTRVRFATARNPPLIERLMQGLRTLLAEGHLATNRPGAPVFVDPDGQHVWIVAGTAADQVRKLLEGREERSEGAAGIPTDNTRFFDTWAEYGALVPPTKEHGKGSVWWVKIEIDDWSHVLTVLKFPIDKVYGPDTPRPAPLNGTVLPVMPSSRSERQEPAAVGDAQPVNDPAGATEYREAAAAVPYGGQASADDSGLSLLLASYDTQGNAIVQSGDVATAATVRNSPINQTPSDSVAPSEGDASQISPAQSEFLDESDSVAAVREPGNGLVVPRTVQAYTTPKNPPRALFKVPGAVTTKLNAESFMKWIQQGLGDGNLTYNESDAFIHFVPGGMAIVTPRAFHRYLETHKFIGEIGKSQDELRALQNEVQKGGYIARSADKSSFHMFSILQSDGSVGDKKITTYLIPNPQAYIRPVPSPNPLLVAAEVKPKKVTVLVASNGAGTS